MQSYKELETDDNLLLEVQKDVLTQNILNTLEKGYSIFDIELVELINNSLNDLEELEKFK